MGNATTTKDNFISKNINTLQSEIDALFIEKKEEKKKYIIDRIESQKQRLLGLLNSKRIDSKVMYSVNNKRKGKKENIIKEIEAQYKSIIDAIKFYLNGDIVSAIASIQTHFFVDSNNNLNRKRFFFREILSLGSTFYRTRPRKMEDKKEPYFQYEMFHIPFEKRGKVNNQRYSFSGFPCLYLGKSVYVSWNETCKHEANVLDAVALRSTKKLNVLSLIIPTIKNEITVQLLKSLPLRLACSLTAADKDAAFKPEYIIPQIVLICVIKERMESEKMKSAKTNAIYEGIQYTSTFYRSFNDVYKNKDLCTNYVFPIVESSHVGMCESLAKYFTMTGTLSVNNTFKNMSSDSVVDSDQKCKFDELELKLIDLPQNEICQ